MQVLHAHWLPSTEASGGARLLFWAETADRLAVKEGLHGRLPKRHCGIVQDCTPHATACDFTIVQPTDELAFPARPPRWDDALPFAFRLLRNAKIKKSILKLDRRHKDIALLQKNYLQAMDDGYIPLMMNYFDIATMTVTEPALLQDQLFRNFFVYTKQDTDTMVAMYRLAQSQSEELVELIEEQLAE